jgi:TPR repeat protein
MMLGRYLARGLGGERNPEEARVWLEKAKAQGLRDAEVDLAALPPPPAPAAAPGYAAQMDAGSS